MYLSGNHWVLCEICFSSWDITVYDSNQSLNSVERFEATMEPMCYMPLRLLRENGFNPCKYKDLSTLAPFVCKRLLPTRVPQTKKR